MSSTAPIHDYYEILGVHQWTDSATITSSYRKLALATHPDRSKAPNATAEFQLLGEAYEHLSDANKRRRYDAIYETVILPNKTQEEPEQKPEQMNPRIAELKARLLQLKTQRKETQTRLRNTKSDLDRIFAEVNDLNREIHRIEMVNMNEELQFIFDYYRNPRERVGMSDRPPQTSRRIRDLMNQQCAKLHESWLAMSRIQSLHSSISSLSSAENRIRAKIRMLERRR